MPDMLYPALPPRPGSSAPTSSYSPYSTLGGGGRSPPSSPPRRVVSEFKPFAAGGGLSVHDAPLGGVNEPIGEGEAKSADEELANSVGLRFAGISLEQVSSRFPLSHIAQVMVTDRCRFAFTG